MATKSTRSKKVYHWIPPQYSALYALTVERSNGTVDTLTQVIHFLEIEDGATDTIGRFEFELWDPAQTYKDVWTGMEIVRYYSDYAATATTLRFRGRIEKVAYVDNKIKVTGRSESLKFIDITVTQDYNSQECSAILKDLVDNYGSGFTYTNVNASSVSITVNWYQKPFWDCVKEICTASGFFCYVDASLDFHFAENGTVINTGEAIVHDYNLLEVTEFAEDLSFVRNRIIVYGAEQEGVQLIYTAEDSTSIASYGAREEIVNDSNITAYLQAKDYGDYLLAEEKDPPEIGEVKGTLLATIQPGESIRLSSPFNNLPPNTYNILSYKHKLDMNTGLTTTVKVNKEPRMFSHVLKSMVERDNAKAQTTANPYEMRYSYNFLFNEDSGTHSTTEIIDGVLKPTVASGTWISDARDLDTNINEAYLILVGETVTGAKVYVSGDNGTNWLLINNKTKISVSNSKGIKLRVKVIFNNADTQIDSLSIQYTVD